MLAGKKTHQFKDVLQGDRCCDRWVGQCWRNPEEGGGIFIFFCALLS